MNIASQSCAMTQGNQLNHGRVVRLNSPGNGVVANMVGQLNKQFKQGSNYANVNVGGITTLRVRLVMHDACVLSFQVIDNSLNAALMGCIEQNELHFWKRDQGVISND